MMIDITLDSSTTPPRLLFAGELTIVSAESSRLSLLQLLAQTGQAPLAIDASPVTAADSAGVQLMLALSHSLQGRGQQAVMSGASPSLLRVAQALGAADSHQCCGFTLNSLEGQAS